jgi:hypothetical protein
MRSQTKKFIKWGGLAAVALIAFSYLLQSVWMSPEIRARVVDEGGKPVKGAVVLLVWMIKAPLNETNYGPIAMYEALTDENGGFVIPGWGPRFDFSGHLQQGEPKTYIFHPDFYPVTEYNLIKDAPLKQFAPVYLGYHMNGKDFQLKTFHGLSKNQAADAKYEGSSKEYLDKLQYLLWGVRDAIEPIERCSWHQAPLMITQLHRAKLSLEKQSEDASILPSIYRALVINYRPACGKAEEFFKGYLK